MSESHVKTYRAKYLPAGISIVASAYGYIGKLAGTGKDTQHYGALIVTPKDVIFYRKGFFGEINQAIPLDKITSVEQSSVLGFKSIRLHTSHDDLSFTTNESAKYQQIVAALEAGRASKTSAAVATDSPLDALKKLGELRAAGVLTDAEFEEKKKSLLARL